MTDEQCPAQQAAARLVIGDAECVACLQIVDDQWQGLVCVFENDRARVYVWQEQEEGDGGRTHTALHKGRVDSAVAAIREWKATSCRKKAPQTN